MTGPGRNQHYLPAAVIGGFSLDNAGRPRERTVWVRRRGVARTFRERAQNLGYGRDLYTLSGGEVSRDLDAGMVDRAWAGYERDLPVAIAALANRAAGPMAARLWAGALVPFVAGLFVRGQGFNRRFEARPIIAAARDYYGLAGFADNTNLARLFEFQRLFYPVATARWTVVHLTPAVAAPAVAVTSDMGYCLTQHRAVGPVGYAIPLRPDTVLVLYRGPGNLWLRWTGQKWAVDGIEHTTTVAWDIANLNEAIAATATEVYGPTATVVNECMRTWERNVASPAPPHAPGPGWLAPDPRRLREREMSRFQLLSVIGSAPAAGTPTALRIR